MTTALLDLAARPSAEIPARPAGEGFNVAAHGLRGVASLMVFAAHMLGGAVEHVYGEGSAYASAVKPFWNFGTFGVCLFFVISGFVILPSAQRYSAREFAARRLVRIYPLFLAFSLFFIVLNAVTGLQPGLNNWTTIAAGLTFTNIFTHTSQLTPNAWSLTYEIWFYIFTAAAVHFSLRRRSQVGTVLVGVAAALFVARYPMSLYFVGGLAVRIAYDRSPQLRRGRHRLLELALLALCILLASRGHYDDYEWVEFQNPVVPMLIVVTTLYFGLAMSSHSITALVLGNRALLYLGTVSYSLYLTHPYTYLVSRMSFLHAGLFSENALLSVSLFVVVTTAVTLTATHFVYNMLERWPYEWVYGQKVYRAFRGRPAVLQGSGSAP